VSRPPRSAAVLLAALAATSACGGGTGHASDETDHDRAADTTTCLADARAIGSYPAGFPADFPLPDHTVVFNAEDRGADGVVVTGVTSLPFEQVLDALNGPAQDAGYQVTTGETEEHDAEANWSGHGYRGRWAIRESAGCAGETVVQVLAAKR
jgi:hypothetical protein